MEKISTSTFSLAGFLVFLLYDIVHEWITVFKKFYSSSLCFIQSQGDNFSYGSSKKVTNFELYKPTVSPHAKVEEDEKLSREEVNMVMETLRFVYEENDEMPRDKLGSREISNMFEVEEPSMEEVKEAFDVFDDDKDGFVDAAELQRVLCILGIPQGSNVEDCAKMIEVFDENRDGLIDFNEFARFMETSFC